MSFLALVGLIFLFFFIREGIKDLRKALAMRVPGSKLGPELGGAYIIGGVVLLYITIVFIKFIVTVAIVGLVVYLILRKKKGGHNG